MHGRVAPDDRVVRRRAIRLFHPAGMLVVAIAGILQFFGQLVVKGPLLFTFVGIFRPDLISHGFNYVIPVPGLGGLNKSNGFFLVEPSSFSQLMALAIIVELEFFKPSWRLGVLGLALMLSFSGTGLLLFAAIVPLYLLRRGWGGVLLLAGPAVLVAAIVLAGPKLAPAAGSVERVRLGPVERLCALPLALLSLQRISVPEPGHDTVRHGTRLDRALFQAGFLSGP